MMYKPPANTTEDEKTLGHGGEHLLKLGAFPSLITLVIREKCNKVTKLRNRCVCSSGGSFVLGSPVSVSEVYF